MSSDLAIIEEAVLFAVPRGEHEELRVTFTRGRTAAGKDVSWHSLRVFWQDDAGVWKPGKQGITIRSRELKPVTETLIKAAAGILPTRGTPPSGYSPQRPPGARAPEHRRSHAAQPALPLEPPLGRFDDDAPDPEGLF
ncbi:MAG TPA: hypothetical protein VII82_15280 [Polyangiaceae bacterium]